MVTPGTRLEWHTAYEWMRCFDELEARRHRSPMFAARDRHLAALAELDAWWDVQPLVDLLVLNHYLRSGPGRKLRPAPGFREGSAYSRALVLLHNAIQAQQGGRL